MVGFKINGKHWEIVLNIGGNYTVVDHVTLLRVFDGDRLVLEA